MSRLQVAVVGITIALNALDGFDVLSISFASPGIASEWGINQAALGIVLSMELIGMAVGNEMRPGGGAGGAHLLGDHIAVEVAALVAAVLPGPGHADPAPGARPARELAVIGGVLLPETGVEGAARRFLGQEGADLIAQLRGFGRQAQGVEADGGLHGFSPTARPA
jgi:hypothetical protein